MMRKTKTKVVCEPFGTFEKKPLVISSKKYKQILSNVNPDDRKRQEAEDEQRYKDYLKEGSDKIVATWPNTFKRTQEQRKAERRQELTEKINQEKQEFLKIREKDEQARKKKIAKAMDLIEKLKPGPKELRSAAIESETLKGRAIHRNITKEFEASQNKRTAAEQLLMERQAMPWIEEEQKRISNCIQRRNEYKAEIMTNINEKARKKTEIYKKELMAGRFALDLCDQEIKAQMEKEQDMVKRKREALRKNLQEALVMVEQRKAREEIQDTVQEKLIAIYNDGKRNIEKIKKTRKEQGIQDQVDLNAVNVQKLLASAPPTAQMEEERLRRDVNTIQQQFTAKEQEKKERIQQQKQARIQQYWQDLNTQKEIQQRKVEETRLALANRFKNDEVNAVFEEKQRVDKVKKAEELRKILAEQVAERKRLDEEEKEFDKKCNSLSFEKDDNFFFDYADRLVADAVKKDRPLYPFVKAVKQYKRENGIGIDRKLPPHLESQLRIGLKTPTPKDCEKTKEETLPCDKTLRYGLDEFKGHEHEQTSPKDK